jgi:hypothetical protein
MSDPLRFEELTPARRRALAAKLDRLSAGFACVAIAAAILIFAGQLIRAAVQSGALI